MDCLTNYIPLPDQLKAMLRSASPLVGLAIVEVTGHEDNAVRCDNSQMTMNDFMAASIGTDSCGKPALRVKIIDSCDPVQACANGEQNQWNNMFAYDSTLGTYALVLNRST